MSRPRPASPLPAGAQTLRQVLATPSLAGATVLAGAAGLERLVERLNVMEVPDILPWVKPDEFLLTTAYPLRETPDALTDLVGDLDAAGLAGLGIKLGRYIDEVPPAVLTRADDLGFPIVQLPDGVSFDEIFNEVLTGILNRQAQKLARSELIHRAFLEIVLAGHGLDRIATELSELIDRPVLVVGTDGRVLAGHRTDEIRGLDDDTRVEIDDATVRIGEVEVAGSVVPVSAGPRTHGHVVAVEDGGAPPVDDRMALESAATVTALVLTKQMELQAVESKYQSDLMHDLLAGRVTTPADAQARARMFGWNLDRPLVVLVVQLDEPRRALQPEALLRPTPLGTAIQQTVRDHDDEAAIVRFSDEVVILTSAFEGDDARGRGRRFAGRLARAGRRTLGDSVSVGLSRPVADLRGIPAAYAQATRALQIGRRVRGEGSWAHFDDLGVYRILTLIDDESELKSFAHETLGELAGDDEHAVDLRRTLEVLLQANCNVAEAARRLHFHYNTLRYRIEKLEGIVGPFTSDPTTRLDVQIALLVLQMRGI